MQFHHIHNLPGHAQYAIYLFSSGFPRMTPQEKKNLTHLMEVLFTETSGITDCAWLDCSPTRAAKEWQLWNWKWPDACHLCFIQCRNNQWTPTHLGNAFSLQCTTMHGDLLPLRMHLKVSRASKKRRKYCCMCHTTEWIGLFITEEMSRWRWLHGMANIHLLL